MVNIGFTAMQNFSKHGHRYFLIEMVFYIFKNGVKYVIIN